MEDTLKQAVNQVPSLVVLVLVVWAFLRHIESQRAAGVLERSELVKAIQATAAESFQARAEMRDIIKDNSKSNTAVAEAVAQMAAAVKMNPIKAHHQS
jgi:predicted transcriptional regulator